MPTIQLIVSGKVQGVYFRASAKKQADSLGLTGWVRNTKDGRVEVVASGSDESICIFRDWCSHGPAGASVKDVEEARSEERKFDGFQIVR